MAECTFNDRLIKAACLVQAPMYKKNKTPACADTKQFK